MKTLDNVILGSKDADRMTNSVQPDQSRTVLSVSTLFALNCLFAYSYFVWSIFPPSFDGISNKKNGYICSNSYVRGMLKNSIDFHCSVNMF